MFMDYNVRFNTESCHVMSGRVVVGEESRSNRPLLGRGDRVSVTGGHLVPISSRSKMTRRTCSRSGRLPSTEAAYLSNRLGGRSRLVPLGSHPNRSETLSWIFTFSREGRPSFFLQGGARMNHLARAKIRHRIYGRLSVEGSGGYARSQFFPNATQFQTITGISRLEYMLRRNIKGKPIFIFTR